MKMELINKQVHLDHPLMVFLLAEKDALQSVYSLALAEVENPIVRTWLVSKIEEVNDAIVSTLKELAEEKV